jgi:hypothetical protein
MLLGCAGCDKTPAEQSAERGKDTLERITQITFVGTVGDASAELTFGPSTADAIKGKLVFLELDEPAVEETLEGVLENSTGFELHGTAVKMLVGEGAPELHLVHLGLIANDALSGRASTRTSTDYPVAVRLVPGKSVTTLATIDVARATGRLLEVRWEGKLEGGSELTLDTRREGAKLVGRLRRGDASTDGFVTVSRIGTFSFRNPPSPGDGKLYAMSCQGQLDATRDAVKGTCETSQRGGFVTNSTTLAFSLHATTLPPPAPTASAAAATASARVTSTVPQAPPRAGSTPAKP